MCGSSQWGFCWSVSVSTCSCVCVVQVQQALSRPEQALLLLDAALRVAPDNALCRYHRAQVATAGRSSSVALFSVSNNLRAQVLLALRRSKDALAELAELKLLAPNEGKVYFLAGKVSQLLFAYLCLVPYRRALVMYSIFQ